METVLIKMMYVVLGLLVGYVLGKRSLDGIEKRLIYFLKLGKKVLIAVDNSAVLYEMVDGKVVMKLGELNTSEGFADDTTTVQTVAEPGLH